VTGTITRLPPASAGVPSVPAAGLDAMQAAAARFLASQDASMATRGAVARDLQALSGAAGPDAAGITSPARDRYTRERGMHFMLMLPPAGQAQEIRRGP
jgi:hypothetical protein